MFAGRSHSAGIELAPDEERLYRLPPMSNGVVIIRAFDAYFSKGPHGEPIHHNSPTGDLELELRHANHLSLPGTNFILTESLWHDDFWRLRVRRPRRTVDPNAPSEPLQYRIEVQYTSQLPVLERRIPVSFFHDGFEVNYNRQQYISAEISGTKVFVNFTPDLVALYGLQNPLSLDMEVPSVVEFRNFRTESVRLDVGAGPAPLGGANALFFSLRADFKAGGVIKQTFDADIDVPAFPFVVRLYLNALGDILSYIPTIEAEVFFDKVDDIAGADGDEKHDELVKKLYELQFPEPGGQGFSVFGQFLKPWLVGGRRELLSLAYAPGPNDTLRPDGIVEPATGDLIVRYVGPKPKPGTVPVLEDPTHPSGPPPDDGSIRLFDLPDEEPAPEPGGGGGGAGGVTPGPIRRPNIGALARIDHIVVLMQENRSFDQVLGYLSRDKINPDVLGLLPLDDPGSQQQFNRFNNRNFFPQKAESTAWPKVIGPSGGLVNSPCHDHDCVVSQMDNMGGFVSNWAVRAGETSPSLHVVMDYFDADQLKVYAVLQREFGVCNHWYTSHVGPTWPNRFVLLTGELNRDPFGNIELDQPDVKTLIPLQTRTLFDLLNELGISWRVFEHGYSFPRLFGNFTFDITNIVPFDDPVRGFEATARSGALPQVTLIEPDYIDLPPGNDDHPPADMAGGQTLVRRIMEALIASPTWERTLFVITYDEHGGFYDHVQPPTDAPPLGGSLTTLGPRVPAFIISPLVERGVEHGTVFNTRFDHTSIGATILRRFAGLRPPPRVSSRLDAARDLRETLTLSEPRPRSDFARLFDGLPQLTPRPSVARSTLPERAAPIGVPDSPKEDFHWLLSAMRLTTGEPPQVSPLRRRPAPMTSGELLYYRDKARNGTGDVSHPSVIGLGGWQNFKFLFSGGNGIIYAVDQSDRLLFYRDRTQDGAGDVANPSVIGKGGWQAFKFLFSGGNGIIYAVDQGGRLLFYRDRTQDGTGDVANPSVIGKGGWQAFKFLFSGGNGIIYAVDQSGRLLFYRDRTQDGTGDVANPSVIGKGGWQAFKFLFSGGNGIIYAVDQIEQRRSVDRDQRPKVGLTKLDVTERIQVQVAGQQDKTVGNGRLLFYCDRTQDGTGDVANPSVIGKGGWQAFRFLFSGGNGIIYAVVA